MKIQDILKHHSDLSLDQIAADKIDEAVSLRLPRAVIEQEISAAMSTLSYVAKALAPSKPPTYAFLKLLLDAPNFQLPVEGFQDRVLKATKIMTQRAESGKGLSANKNYDLYIKILKTAWESDEQIDRSEALLLEAIREELGIWHREHLLLEHHPSVRQFWDYPGSYVTTRNHLLMTGLVMTHGNDYVIVEEVVLQIRRAWGIELSENSYERLLAALKTDQLYTILECTGLQVSGTKEQRIWRLIKALVPPNEVLDFLHIDDLRNFCRKNGIQVSGRKSEVIGNIIYHYDQNLDLLKPDEEKPVDPFPPEPERRELSDDALTQLLKHLTNDQLYDVLANCYLRTSGTKQEKVERLVQSPWAERTMLEHLRKTDLAHLCRHLYAPVSGAKGELLDRIIDNARRVPIEDKAMEEDQQSQPEAVITKKYPDKVFQLFGDGEESHDFWVDYIKNGKAYGSQARVVYDEYDESKLKD